MVIGSTPQLQPQTRQCCRPSRAGCPRAHRLPAGETPTLRRAALGRDCGSRSSPQMPRKPRHLPQGHSFHITLRCNSRQFLIAKGLRRDVLLAVLAKAQTKIPHKLYGVCLMANHLHLLIRPDDASQLPRLMHWIGWYSAMALNRLAGRCGHFPPVSGKLSPL
jgi:REP element-mobilizing transposase RayT